MGYGLEKAEEGMWVDMLEAPAVVQEGRNGSLDWCVSGRWRKEGKSEINLGTPVIKLDGFSYYMTSQSL